jgi:hypothetical protein
MLPFVLQFSLDTHNLRFRTMTSVQWQTHKCHWTQGTMRHHTAPGSRRRNHRSEATGPEGSTSCCLYWATVWVSAMCGDSRISATTTEEVRQCSDEPEDAPLRDIWDLRATSRKMAVLWDVEPCTWLTALTMEAVNIFETSVNFYETTRRNIPEDSHLQDLVWHKRSSIVPTWRAAN